MKAITVQNPPAHAIAFLGKSVENRSRPTHHRGLLAIHAGLGWSQQHADSLIYLRAWTRWAAAIPALPPGTPGRLHRDNEWITVSAVVALVDVVGCHQARPGDTETGVCCAPWGELLSHTEPTFHWELGNIRPCITNRESRITRGWLGLWRLPDDVAAVALKAAGGNQPQRILGLSIRHTEET